MNNPYINAQLMVKAMDGTTNNYMRLSTLALITALAFFYNVDFFLPDIPGRTNYPVMYLFGTIAAASAVIFTIFSNFPIYIAFPFWSLTYVLTIPHFAGGYTLHIMLSATTLIHAAMVAGLATLANWYVRKLGSYLQQEHQSVNYTIAPPLLEDELKHIKYEITRARRYNHPMSVIMIQSLSKFYGSMEKGLLSNTLSKTFRRTERLYDMGKQGRFLIFCPETTNSSAEMLVNRIRIMAHREQEIHFNYGIATFPDQELTFEGLVLRAKENLEAGTSNKSAVIKVIKDGKLMANR